MGLRCGLFPVVWCTRVFCGLWASVCRLVVWRVKDPTCPVLAFLFPLSAFLILFGLATETRNILRLLETADSSFARINQLFVALDSDFVFFLLSAHTIKQLCMRALRREVACLYACMVLPAYTPVMLADSV